MHDFLFENQLRRYAEEVELDLERYDYEMRAHALRVPAFRAA